MVDDGVKEQVKEATDIAAVIGQFVTLRKRGAGFIGLCPFHTEKTPSFNVHPDRRFFHCFGCGKGGDVFTFLMEQEGWSFPETLKYCADRAGIRLPERRSDDDAASRRREAMLDALSLADAMYRRLLFSDDGRGARHYLNERGFGDATLKRAGVGYAPAGYDRFLKAARGRGISVDVLEAAGMTLKSRKTGEPFDRFRNRVTFPIVNLSGKTVGFGARALAADDNPKYLNSPETALYQKSRILYGLVATREAIRKADRAIIVEGYFDWLRMVEAGLDHVVAVSGTALTRPQADLLKRFCGHVTLLFDGDQAGQRATLRGVEVAFNAALGVDVAVMPAGDDPDSYLAREGAEKLQALLGAAPGIVAYRVQVARQAAGGHLDFLAREQLVKEFADLLRLIEDVDRREMLLGEVAGTLDVNEGHLRRALSRKSAPESGSAQTAPRAHRHILTKYNEFLRLLVEEPAYLERARAVVVASDFEHPLHRRMYEALLDLDAEAVKGASPEDLGSSPEEVAVWSRLLAFGIDSTKSDRVFEDVLQEVAKRRRPVLSIREQIVQAQRDGDKELAVRLHAELAESMRLDRGEGEGEPAGGDPAEQA